jgi:PKD repeat protein
MLAAMAGERLIRSSRRIAIAAGALVVLLLLTAWAARPGAALAAETVVSFDTLTAGERVSTQYEAQGLKLGFAGEFGQGSPEKEKEGNCGAPTVESESGPKGVKAASPPNYAILPACPSAAARWEGTYGALLGAPRGAISVEVSDLASSPPVEVQLIAYNSAGKEVARATGSATSGVWQRIALAPAGEAQISYFMIRTAMPVFSGEVGIDNLSFEKPTESTGGGGGGSTGTGVTPPKAVLALQGPATPGHALTLTGAGSSAGSGQIVSYEWDFTGSGKINTSTGTNPVAHVILPPGLHTIGLRVVSSNGETSTTKLPISLSPVSVKANIQAWLKDGGEGACQQSLELRDVEMLGECIQTTKGSAHDWVIGTAQLDLNGMTLTPKPGYSGVFRVTLEGLYYRLSGPPVNVELLNTPIGDITVGGYNLETEPLTLENIATAPLPSVITLFGAKGSPPPGVRSAFTSAGADGAHAAMDERHEIKAKGMVLMSVGVGHECKAGSKEVGCCPPSGPTKSCATLPGDFPLTGQVVVYLTGKGEVLFDVQVGLNLKDVKFEATGELEIEASLEGGIELSSLKFTIPEANLAPIFTVKEASFAYYGPGNPDIYKRNTWQAKGSIGFGELAQGIEGELEFKEGNFHKASLVLTLPPGTGITLYPGIELNKLGATVGVEPTTFGGLLGASIATQLELTLQFEYAEPTLTELGFFGGKGQLTFHGDEFATLEGDVYSDGYTDALLKIDLQLPFESKSPVAEIEGEIGYWDEPNSGLWQARGTIKAHVWIINAEVSGLINNKYAAACGSVGIGAEADWSFERSELELEGFLGNCKDHLKKFTELPLVKHVGGFVNETETESLRGPLRTPTFVAALAHTTGEATFALAAAPLGEDLRISSPSGTPVVKLVGPGGQTFTTPSTPGQVAKSGSQFYAALGSNPHDVIVYLASPQAGEWHIHRVAGSAPIAKVEGAEVAPAPVISTRVHHGRRGWSLAYKVGHYTSGMQVQFVERGRDSSHILARVARPSGTVHFVPAEGLARSRRIEAELLSPFGAPEQVMIVGHYSAPAPFRSARPRALKLTRHGSDAVLSWGAVPGARAYRVRIHGSDGRLDTFLATPRRLREMAVNVLPIQSFTATVIALGGKDLLPGPAARTSLSAVRARHPSPRHHGSTKRK